MTVKDAKPSAETSQYPSPLYLCFFLSVVVFLIPTRAVAQSASKYGGELVSSTVSDPKSFNDIIAKETSTTLVTSLIFEGLTDIDAYTTEVVPELAKSWQVDESGLAWTFTLRDDVTWNDGVKFTADDVVFTFNDLIFNDAIPSSARDIFTIEGKTIDVQKIDDYTVKFILPVKFAPFLMGMGQAILPKHKLEAAVRDGNFNFTWGIDTDPKEIVGTGPFKLARYDPGQRLVFERNPNYWKVSKNGDRLPYLNKIIYMIVQNPDVEMLKFLEGTVDAYGMGGRDYPLLKPIEEKKDFTIYDLGPDLGSQFVFFNQNRGVHPETGKPFVAAHKLAWFTNRDFRRAIAHAIDRDQIIKIVKNGLGYPQYSPIGPGAGFFHKPNVEAYPYDLAKAKEILESAGFEDRDGDKILEDPQGKPLEFNLFTNSNSVERIDIGGILRQDLEKIGMKVNFQTLEFNTLVSKINSSFEYDAIILGLTGGIEPHFGKNVWNSGGQLHMWYPKQETPATPWEARIDEIFNLGVQELDPAKRKVLYDEYQDIVAHELPLIYTALSAKLTAVRNKFGNISPTNYGGVFHNLEEIYVLPNYR